MSSCKYGQFLLYFCSISKVTYLCWSILKITCLQLLPLKKCNIRLFKMFRLINPHPIYYMHISVLLLVTHFVLSALFNVYTLILIDLVDLLRRHVHCIYVSLCLMIKYRCTIILITMTIIRICMDFILCTH